VPGLGIAGIFSLAGDAIMEAAKGLDLFNSKWDRLNTLLGSDSVTQAKKDMSELYISVNLLHEGLISKEKFLEQYNATLGKTAGYTQDVNKAEKSILENAEAYIEMVILKADAEELLSTAIEKSAKARKFQRDEDSFFSTLKAQAIKGFNDFKKTGNFGLLFMADPTEARAEYQIAANLEAKIAQDAWVEARTKLAQQIKNNNFSDIDSVAPKKATAEKEVNRIEALKNQYEEEVSLLKIKLNKEQITEEEFYSRMIDLSRKYYAERKGLTEKEKDSEVKFNEVLSKSEKENHDAILKWLEEEVLKAGESDEKRLKASLKRIEEIRKANEKAYQEELDYIKGQMDAQERMFAEDERQSNEAFARKTKYLNSTNELVQASTSALSSVGDIMYMRDMERIDAKNQALKDYYDNELRAIEESGLSQELQSKAKRKLDAETAAQQRQIDRDRISAMRKQASIQKGIDIASLIGSTTVAVMSALGAKPYSPLNIALAAGAAAKGAGELARLIATPLPQYAKGRKGGPAEWAIVSEIGQEAKVSKTGEFSLLPATKSKVFLNEGDSVIPHMDVLKHASRLRLAYSSLNKSDSSNDALLHAHDEELKELRGIKMAVINKNLSPSYHSLQGYDNYKQSNRM
jgi:hypothetical protein